MKAQVSVTNNWIGVFPTGGGPYNNLGDGIGASVIDRVVFRLSMDVNDSF